MIPYSLVVPHVGNSFIDRVRMDSRPRGTEFLNIPMIDAFGLRPKPLIPESFATRNMGPANYPVVDAGYMQVPTVKGSIVPTDNTTWKTANPASNQMPSLAVPSSQIQDQNQNTLLTDAEIILASQNGSEIITITRRNLLLLMLIVVLVVILVAKLLK